VQVDVPHRGGDAVVVRVEQEGAHVPAAGEVYLRHGPGRQGIHVRHRVETQIARGDVDVVDVEQHPAPGCLDEPAEELGLGHRRLGEAEIGRRVLQHQRPPQHVLRRANPRGDVREARLGARHGQQLVRVDTVHTGPAEVVGDPAGADVVGEVPQPGEIAEVQRVGAADRHRQPVQHDRVPRGEIVQHGALLVAGAQIVLGDGLEEVESGAGLEEFGEHRGPHTDPETEILSGFRCGR
jgi:hypothetical protein